MRKLHSILLVLLMITSWVTSADAAEAPHAGDRPTIGLVLSGGGARGSAHVGVLEVLEELNVPVDLVVGTSMGAIIGGLYAAGVSPDEMRQFLVDADWRDLLDDDPPRRHLPFRRKVEDQTYLIDFEAGFNGGALQLPPGLISGQKLGFALQSLTLDTAGIDDFDRLPIPFRAIATDLETGEAVILARGDLGTAMRASMSVPGVFSPIEIDGRLLVDGGLVKNLPVDVARAMGAEIVIAVDVGAPPLHREDLQSLPGVTSQMLGLQVLRGSIEQVEDADILVTPELTGYGSTQFERALEMVPRGAAAARAVTAELAALSIKSEAFAARIGELRKPLLDGEAKIRSVQLTRSSTAEGSFVLRQIETRPGDVLDLEAIREDLERLYETGDYERVDFHLVRTEEGYILFIEAIDKPWGPNYLRFGLNLTADMEGESSVDVLASYTMTRLNRRRGEMRIHARVGEHPGVSAEFYQPLTLDQTWFGALRLLQSTSTEYLPVGHGTFAPYRTDVVLGGVDLGLQLSHYAEIRLGIDRGTVRSELRDRVGPVDPPSEMEADLGGIHLVTVVDQFDDMNFPRHGYFALVDYQHSLESLGSETDYQHLVGFIGGAVTRGRNTLLALSNLVSALGTVSPEVYELGGLFKLSGTTPGHVTGQYGGNLSLVYLRRVSDLPIGLGNGVYIGGSVEAGNLWPDASSVDFGELRYAASLTVGADTILGPVYLAQGFTEGGEQASYLFIGRSF